MVSLRKAKKMNRSVGVRDVLLVCITVALASSRPLPSCRVCRRGAEAVDFGEEATSLHVPI